MSLTSSRGAHIVNWSTRQTKSKCMRCVFVSDEATLKPKYEIFCKKLESPHEAFKEILSTIDGWPARPLCNACEQSKCSRCTTSPTLGSARASVEFSNQIDAGADPRDAFFIALAQVRYRPRWLCDQCAKKK